MFSAVFLNERHFYAFIGVIEDLVMSDVDSLSLVHQELMSLVHQELVKRLDLACPVSIFSSASK